MSANKRYLNRSRKRPNDNFTAVSNTIFRHMIEGDVTAATVGVFMLMWSRPDDWQFYIGELRKATGLGRDKLQRCLKELEAIGFLWREYGGVDGGCEWYLNDTGAPEAVNDTTFDDGELLEVDAPEDRPPENPVDGAAVDMAPPVEPARRETRPPESQAGNTKDSLPLTTEEEPNTDGPSIERMRMGAEWYLNKMHDLGNVNVTVQQEPRERTVQRWAEQWAKVYMKLGAAQFERFTEALDWALKQPKGDDARFWFEGAQGRCDSPGAWLKPIRGEETLRAEALIRKYEVHLAKRDDARVAQRAATARRRAASPEARMGALLHGGSK